MDEILLLLLKKNAHIQPLHITTTELGKMLGMSQQNVSRRIMQLENDKLISKTKNGLTITKNGSDEIYSIYAELKKLFEKNILTISGTIISGLGEGRYYMSFLEYKKQIKEKIGFIPYKGTLNIKLLSSEIAKKTYYIKNFEPVIINGFKKGERTFGDLFIYPCTLNGIKCALVIPLRTHHPSEIIEIISAINLKNKLMKKDGDKVKLKFA